ncbi:hypothetical protein BDV36DRAFT_276583 [Aspergillus pseudocaelatus]|uniref:Uncharacterized protein n=1 Tax=Aspergillus pseudocaelatus TaxID=1825620 RepID=A0ABQ6W129_9EURO|nr:hypothetical protein BDV36DRAFT_276583 [Aspergillus pseudocaelatus]
MTGNNQSKTVNPEERRQDLIESLSFVIYNDLRRHAAHIDRHFLMPTNFLYDTFPTRTVFRSMDTELSSRSSSMLKRPATALLPEIPSENLTQRALKKLKQVPESPSSNPPTTAHSPISTTDAHNLKRFARHGGPDLTDIRGVSIHTIHQLAIMIHDL